MWTLTRIATGEAFFMFPHIQYKIGRQTADLVLKDKSISGVHAIIVAKNESGTESLVLEDAGSKNGTFINENIKRRRPIKKNSPVQLQKGDYVQFGVMGNCWHVHYTSYCTSSSGVTSEDIVELEHLLTECGGKHVSAHDKACTHLTMKDIKMTLKVVYALLDEIPIVSFDYWVDILNVARKNKKGPISAEKYIPNVTDVLLVQQNVHFHKREGRKDVFSEKVFVFLSQKQFEVYASIVEKAGGCSRSLKNGVQKQFLLNKNVVIIQYCPSSESQRSQGSQTINTIAEYLHSQSRRFVPEYEIAMAIVHCSTEKYCNPDYRILSNMLSSTTTLDEPNSVSAENTHSLKTPTNNDSDLIIVETESSQKTLLPNQMTEALDDDTIISLKESKSKNKCDRLGEQYFGKTFPPCVFDSYDEKVTPQQSLNKNRNIEVRKSFELKIPGLSDDDDDLFNFRDDALLFLPTKKPRYELHCYDSEHIIAPSFKNKLMSSKSFCETKLIPKLHLVSKSPFPNTIKFLLKPRMIAQKLNTDGWNGKIQTLQKLEGNKEKETVKNENGSHNLKSFNGGFQVKMKNLTLHNFEKLSLRAKTSNIHLSNSCSYKSRSFKKFAKQKLSQWYH